MPTSENLGIKRHATLVKKSSQLSILCDAEVAIIAFSRDGKLHEYSSTTMEHTLSRYNSHSTNKNKNNNNNKAESRPPKEPRRCSKPPPSKQVEETKSCSGNINDRALDVMEGKVAALRLEKAQRMGKKLEGLSKEELCALEEQQILALLAVNKKKKELVVEMLQRSRSMTVAEKEKLLMARGFEGMTMREKPHVIQDNAPSRMASCTNSKPIKLFNCIIQQ